MSGSPIFKKFLGAKLLLDLFARQSGEYQFHFGLKLKLNKTSSSCMKFY